jgi:hypothetical protein
LLGAVDHYPRWYPDAAKRVAVLERDSGGRPIRVEATIHVARGPLVKDFELTLAVDVDPGRSVTLTRLLNEPSDPEEFVVTWRFEGFKESDRTQIHLELDAKLDVPRLVPLGDLGDAVAAGFVAAAIGELESEPAAGSATRRSGA